MPRRATGGHGRSERWRGGGLHRCGLVEMRWAPPLRFGGDAVGSTARLRPGVSPGEWSGRGSRPARYGTESRGTRDSLECLRLDAAFPPGAGSRAKRCRATGSPKLGLAAGAVWDCGQASLQRSGAAAARGRRGMGLSPGGHGTLWSACGLTQLFPLAPGPGQSGVKPPAVQSLAWRPARYGAEARRLSRRVGSSARISHRCGCLPLPPGAESAGRERRSAGNRPCETR